MRTRRSWIGLVAMIALIGSSGCIGRYARPGPIRWQQYNASVYDLYPDQDAGPEVVGARPSGYQKPKTQADRSRWVWSNLGGPPVPNYSN